jgi:hypothetical protein
VCTPAGIGEQIKPLADTFLRMIKMIIAPLLFSTLVVGIAGTGDLKAMGRIGLKAIIYFEVATTIALFLGLFIVNFFQPGVGVQAPAMSVDSLKAVQSIQAHTGWDMLVSLFPTSVIDSMARGDILQVVVFSIFFGVGLAAVGEKGRAVTEVLESTAQVMFKFTGYVMKFAPIGVMAAISATVGKMGIGILFTLGKLVVLMYGGLIVFSIVVVGGAALIIRVPFFTFLRAIREPFLIAFHTASSEGRAAEGARSDGEVRLSQEHRRPGVADGLQLQSGRDDAVSLTGERVRGAALRCADDVRAADGDDADVDGDEQRRRGSPARGARRAHGHARPVQAPARGRRHPARHRSDPRYGPNVRECHGQLHRHGRRSPAGKACSTTRK